MRGMGQGPRVVGQGVWRSRRGEGHIDIPAILGVMLRINDLVGVRFAQMGSERLHR